MDIVRCAMTAHLLQRRKTMRKARALLVRLAVAGSLVFSSACGKSSPTAPTSNPMAPTRIIGLEIRIRDGSELGRPIPQEGVAVGQGVEINLIYNTPEIGRAVRRSIEVTCVSGPPYSQSSEIRVDDTGDRRFGLTYWPSTTGEHKVLASLFESLGTQSREGTFAVR